MISCKKCIIEITRLNDRLAMCDEHYLEFYNKAMTDLRTMNFDPDWENDLKKQAEGPEHPYEKNEIQQSKSRE
jgi:hypothetical protein